MGTFLGRDLNLGLLKKGAPVIFKVVWDRPNSQVFFQAGKATATFPNTLSSTNTDIAPFPSLETNTFPAIRSSGPASFADMDASWDNVFVPFQPS